MLNLALRREHSMCTHSTCRLLLCVSRNVDVGCSTYSDPNHKCPILDFLMGYGMGHKRYVNYMFVKCAIDGGGKKVS